MARFRAYTTDSEEEQEEQEIVSVSSGEEDEKNAIDSDVESFLDEEALGPSKKMRRGEYQRRATAESDDSGMYSDENAESGDQDEGSSPSPSPAFAERKVADPTIIPWAREVGVDPQRMHVMQTSLFRLPEEAAAMKEIVTLKPPSRKTLLLSNTLSRKHSRDSEGEGLRAESKQRASFAHAVEPTPYRPIRKYARVEGSASTVKGHEEELVDAGLSMGRSFRVGWGPGGTLVHVGSLCGPSRTSTVTANTSVLTITTVPLLSMLDGEAIERAGKLLSHHLSNSPIEPDADGVPFANPSRKLSFSSFASLFQSTDRTFEASLFRLGQALFDPQDLQLSNSITVDIRNCVSNIRRKSALSDWLQAAVGSSVDADLRENPAVNWTGTVFSLLTGNQIERACEIAVDSGNVKLATLLSQCPGDEEFKEDLRTQLNLWREQRIDVHIDESLRKVYALLAGIVHILEGSKGTDLERCPDLPVANGLDWKRVFGLHLWFGEPMDASISDVFSAYDRHSKDHSASAAPPSPWYREATSSDVPESKWTLPPKSQPPDAAFSLIRLFADLTCSLSDILTPFSFESSPVDYRLPWHLYVILSRCLRIRDFADRGDPGVDSGSVGEDDEDSRVEGHSPSADLLANSYAMQLERLGMIQEAVFVLLHIEGSNGRRRAVKELLCRNASKLDDWMFRGLVGSLKIPAPWVYEAKAVQAVDSGDLYGAYECYLSAEMYNKAHDIAVLELAPDAVIRQDLSLLKELFEKISRQPVEDWHIRGKVFVDYANAMTRLPELREALEDSNAVPDAAQASELEELTRSVPKLISILPDILPDRSDIRYNVALSEMIAGLTRCLDQVRPLAIQSQLRTPLATDSTRLKHIHASAYERFLRTIEAA